MDSFHSSISTVLRSQVCVYLFKIIKTRWTQKLGTYYSSLIDSYLTITYHLEKKNVIFTCMWPRIKINTCITFVFLSMGLNIDQPMKYRVSQFFFRTTIIVWYYRLCKRWIKLFPFVGSVKMPKKNSKFLEVLWWNTSNFNYIFLWCMGCHSRGNQNTR